jgi:PKD repeat protein
VRGEKSPLANRRIIAAMLVVALLLNFPIMLAHAPPSEPHAADAMWVEPSSSVFSALANFNVTVWMNITENVFAYQVDLLYNSTQLNCTRAGYTAGGSSNYFKGHVTVSPPPVLSTGSVLAFESLSGSDMLQGPHCDSLVWAQFQILTAPTSGNFTSEFDISTEYPTNTWVLDPNLNNIPIVPYNANYTFIGPRPSPLSVTISANSTSIYIGQSALFTSTVTGGTSPYTYQWFLNSTSVPSVTSSNWTYTPASVGSASVYLNVTDSSATTAESNTITINVLPPLTGAKIYVDPPKIIDLSMGPGSTFPINITVANVASLGACVFNLTYDPTVLTWTGFDFVPAQGEYPTFVITGNSITGFAWISLYYLTPISALSQPLTTLNFYVNSYGISPFNLTDTELLDQNGNPITHNVFDGIFANIIRDVAVTNVVPSSSWVYQTWTDNVNVTIANLGNVTENTTASAWYNSSLIGAVPITNLAPSTQTTVSIPWNTTGVAPGNYTITGTASFVPYETYFNTTNNIYVDGVVEVFTVIHDVAITAIKPAVTWAYVNSTVPINVTASSLGNASETFTVTAYYDGNITIGTLPVTNLASGTSTILTFYWNTTGITVEGNYSLAAFASYVPFEYNLTNNYLQEGQVLILTQIRDVAITNVTTASYWATNWAYQGANINVTVTANNTGQVPESFYVAALCNISLIGNVSVSLAPGTGVNEIFALNTTGLPIYQNLTISAQASIVPYEFNVSNNFFVDGNVTVRFMGDVNGDGRVDGRDIAAVAKAFASVGPNYLYPGSPASPSWNIVCDLNMDNRIDGRDIAIAARNFGKMYP